MVNVRIWINKMTSIRIPKVTIRIEHHLTLDDMITGLCSARIRHTSKFERDQLPEQLSARQIVDEVKGQYEFYGTNAVWTWSDYEDEHVAQMGRAWAERVILRAIPDLADGQS